jgi:hypothetical protein
VSTSAPTTAPRAERILEVLDRVRSALPILLPYVVLASLYAWQASQHRTPWLFGDELEFTQISRAVAETGEAARRGEPLTSQFSLYPWLTAPAWWLESTRDAYELVKLVGVLAMTAAFFPAYALARLLVSRPAAVAAGVGAVAVPALVYSSFVVEEPFAYAWSTLCLYLIVRSLVAPTRRLVVAAVAAAVVAPLLRDELMIVPLVFAASAAAWAWGSEPLRRRRAEWGVLHHVGIAAAALVGLVLLHLAYRSRSGEWAAATQHPDRMLEYGLWAVAALAIGVALLPFVATLALLGVRTAPEERALRAFRTVLAFALVGYGLYTAVKATYISIEFALRVEERNLIYILPLVAVATAVVVERRRLALWSLAAGTALTAYVLVNTPYQMDFRFYFDAPGLAILAWWNREHGWTPDHAETMLLWILAASTALLLAVRFLPLRRFATGIGATGAALCVAWAVNGQIAAAAGAEASADSFLRNLPQPVDWLDRATGGEPVLYLGQKIADPNGVNLLEFWNRSLKKVYSLDGTAPGPGPTVTPNLTNRRGELEGDPGYHWVVADVGISLVGEVAETKGGWRLYRTDGRLRLEEAVRGVYSDGWIGSSQPEGVVRANYSRFSTPGDRAGTITVTLSRKAFCGPKAPGRVEIRVGTLALGPEVNGVVGRETATRTWTIDSCAERPFPIPAPKPPFHVEVTVAPPFVPQQLDPANPETRWLGAKVAFEWSPGPPHPETSAP